MNSIIPFKYSETVTIKGKCFIISLSSENPDVVTLTNYSTESDLKAKQYVFELSGNICNSIITHVESMSYKKTDDKGHVYLVSDGEFTKIGSTRYNIQKRLNELQVGNAKELSIVGSYSVPRKLSAEKFLHEKYSNLKVRGEWFNLRAGDVNSILANKYCPQECYLDGQLCESESASLAETLRNIFTIHIKLIERKKARLYNAIFGDRGIYWSLNQRDRNSLKRTNPFLFKKAA